MLNKLGISIGLLAFSFQCMASEEAGSAKTYKNVGYVFQRGTDISKLDVTKVTHINYSFGLIHNDEYKQTNPATGNVFGTPKNPDVRTPEPVPEGKHHTIFLPEKVASDLARLGEWRKKNPKLKVLLSVGGFDARGFCDAAANEKNRKIFSGSCKEVVDKYGLDGIDLDWEYPVNGGWGSIKCSGSDRTNFTALLGDVRKAIGKDKLLSIAGSGNLDFTSSWTEFQKVMAQLDYINIMTYDFQYGTCYFGSAIYPSKTWVTKSAGDDYNCEKAVRNYLNNGCPPEKINLGLAFGAIIPQVVQSDQKVWPEIKKKLDAVGFKNFGEGNLKAVKEALEDKNGFSKKWDADARVMYITTKINNKDQFVLSYIEPKGLSEKIKYVKDLNLGGTMFWEFGSDYDNSLVTQITSEFSK